MGRPKSQTPPNAEAIKEVFALLWEKYGGQRGLAEAYGVSQQVAADGWHKGRASAETLRLIREREGLSIDALLDGKVLFTDAGKPIAPLMGPKERALNAARTLGGFSFEVLMEVAQMEGERSASEWLLIISQKEATRRMVEEPRPQRPGRKPKA